MANQIATSVHFGPPILDNYSGQGFSIMSTYINSLLCLILITVVICLLPEF